MKKYIEIEYVEQLIDLYEKKDKAWFQDKKKKYEDKIAKHINWMKRNSRTLEDCITLQGLKEDK